MSIRLYSYSKQSIFKIEQYKICGYILNLQDEDLMSFSRKKQSYKVNILKKSYLLLCTCCTQEKKIKANITQ